MKVHHALYYSGNEGLSAARARADEVRKDKNAAIILDADAWMNDKESVDKVEFFNVGKDRKAAIEARYADLPDVPDADAIVIPDNWEELGFAELQGLASRISNGPVRSKDEAMHVIQAYVDQHATDPTKDADAPSSSAEASSATKSRRRRK